LSVFRKSEDKDTAHRPLKLGSFNDVLITTTCDVHPQMFEFYSRTRIGSAEKRRITEFCANVFDGKVYIYGKAPVTNSNIPQRLYISLDLCLLLSAYTANRSFNGKMLDPRWIDSNQFRRWKRECDSQEKKDCQMGLATGRLAPARPAWLVDTWRLCLVQGVVNTPYVALSYVWGKHRFFKTLKNNLAQLQKDRAFSDCQAKLGVPRTIADAISVVGLLEERYLWVDALCIVQDDESTRHDQLNNMASIFAAATVTIVAEQGPDADYGLRGLRGISHPRSLKQDVFRLAKGYEVTEIRSREFPPSIWSRRGWTLQEELFSKRTLVFTDDMVQWRCACCSCFEGLQQSKPYRNQSGLNRLTSLFLSPVPDLGGYEELVQNYNIRQLTHPEDVLAAFSGITTALSQTFHGGFICGLPSLFFDIALCWEPLGLCKRRIPSCSSSATMAGLPSWSWAGWEGAISWNSKAGMDYLKSPGFHASSLRIVSSVQWYCKAWGTKESRPIRGPKQMETSRALTAEDRDHLPAGWTRFEYKSDSDFSLWPFYWDRCDISTPPRYYYKHESDSNAEFWYPIPPCDGLEAPLPRHPETLINCHTQRTWLYVANRVDDTYHSTYSLCDAEGVWVGHLGLPNEPENRLSNSICEFVEISRGYAVEGDLLIGIVDEMEHPDRPKLPKGEKYEFINVLWIEWEEGIAYRKAYGRVMKSAWEAQELEWIDLTLG
jgi:hypothetical protein